MGDLMTRRLAILQSQPHKKTATGGIVVLRKAVPGPLTITTTGSSVIVAGANLYDKSARVTGYIDSEGAEQPSSSGSWSRSDYIPIAGLTAFTYMGILNVGSTPYSCFYRADKSVLLPFKQSAGFVLSSVPEDAAYVRFSIMQSVNSPEYDSFCVRADCGTTYVAYTGQSGAATGRKSVRGVNTVWANSGDVTVTYWGY